MAQRIFISYSHKDERHVERLHVHLTQAIRDEVFQCWFDREISAGADIDPEISRQLELADIFLAFVGPDFLASSYCYETELTSALTRKSNGTMIVIPIIVEACDWKSSPLGKLKALPKDGRPIADWPNENAALLTVVESLKLVCREDRQRIETKSIPVQGLKAITQSSAGYRVRKRFTPFDKEEFLESSFLTVMRCFQEWAIELSTIEGVRCRTRVNSSQKFSCTIENSAYGATETVWVRHGLGGMPGISIMYGEHARDSSSNGIFYAEADDYELYLSGGSFAFGETPSRMNAHNVSQVIWTEILRKVGIDPV